MGGVIGPCRLGPEWLAGTGSEALGAHEAGDTIFRAGVSASDELVCHAGAAVGACVAVVMDRFYGPKKPLILLTTLAGPAAGGGVVAASGDVERIAEFGDGVGVPHGLDQRIPLCGSSESMLTAFFKISRWRRRYSTSRWRRRISAAGSVNPASLRPFGSAEAACAARDLPRALSRQVRSELAEMPSSSATRLSGRPLLRRRFTASFWKSLP